MATTRRIRSIMRTLFSLLAVILLMGCGSTDSRDSRQDAPDTGIPEVTETSQPDRIEPRDVADESGAQDGEDLGEPCKDHHYVVAAGTSTSLEFQVLLKREVYMLEAYSKLKFDPEEVSIKDGGDYWTKMGVIRDDHSISVDSIDTSTELWGVQAEELLQKHADQPGELTSISRTYGGNTQYKIRFYNEGFGLFTRLGRIWPEEKIAEMSEEEVSEALGNTMELNHVDQKFGTFKLPVELIPVDSQCYILTVTYDLSFPDDLKTRTKGTDLWQTVYIGKQADAKFKLYFNYDKKRRLFHVFGPWFEESCY